MCGVVMVYRCVVVWYISVWCGNGISVCGGVVYQCVVVWCIGVW